MKISSARMLGMESLSEWSGEVEDLAKLAHSGDIKGLVSEYLCMEWSDG